MTILLLWVICLFPSLLHAAIHQVGATRILKTPAAAALIAQSGDTIEFDPELFSNGGAIWNASNLLLKSIGGRATITGPSVGGKALWLLVGNNITVENLIIQGAVVPDGNGAAVKTEGRHYTFLSNIIRWNQMGILTGGPEADTVGSVITIENSEFYQNGTSDGYTHNVYISKGTKLIFRYNWSYCSNGGQLLKTRTAVSVVVNNRFVDPPGCNSNQEVDFSNGGDVTFVGNTVRQDQNTTNSSMWMYMSEGPGKHTVHKIVFSANTLLQERDPVGPFVHYWGTPDLREFADNAFIGRGTILAHTGAQTPQPLPPNNLSIPLLADAKFVDMSNQQYRPRPDSPLVDKGGHVSAATRALLATQYAHPVRSHPRTQQGASFDVGAYEAGDVPPPGPLAAPYLTGALGTPPTGQLSWWPATVEGAIRTRYEVQRNGVVLPIQGGLAFNEALQPGTPTKYTVTAVIDDQRSPVSNVVTLTFPRKSATIPLETGWTEILGTAFKPICEATGAAPGNIGCRAIVDAWNSAAFDPIWHRLLLWGGGHNDYQGNEVYAVSLATTTPTVTRLTRPGTPYGTLGTCQEAIANGMQPNSRHTYDGLTFITHVNTFFSFGGALACYDSWTSNSFWFLNMATLKWEERQPDVELFNKTTQTWVKSTQPLTDRPQRQEGAMVDYDIEKKLVIISDKVCLYTYNYDTNTVRRLSCQKDFTLPQLDYKDTGIFDPTTRKFHVLGNKEHYMYSADPPYTGIRVGLIGDRTMANAYYPGLTYDTLRKQIVGWDGGDSIWRFDYSKNQWLSTWFPAGPGAHNPTGTYKRFKYIPGKDYFWLTNNGNQNMFTLRLPSITTPSIFKGLLNILIGNTP